MKINFSLASLVGLALTALPSMANDVMVDTAWGQAIRVSGPNYGGIQQSVGGSMTVTFTSTNAYAELVFRDVNFNYGPPGQVIYIYPNRVSITPITVPSIVYLSGSSSHPWYYPTGEAFGHIFPISGSQSFYEFDSKSFTVAYPN